MYILKDRTPVPIENALDWGRWFEKNYGKRRVGDDKSHGYRISTVFLGLDHQFEEGPPLVFELMVFNPEGNAVFCDRFPTWEEAEQAHNQMCEQVRRHASAYGHLENFDW